MTHRLGLYGGSFDPIHFGHLISARAIAEHFDLDRVVLIPAARPPHKSNRMMTPVELRLAMARLAVDGDPLFDVSDVEANRAGPSFTFDTVAYFRHLHGPATELFWVIGADTLPDLASWHRAPELVDAVRIVSAARPGWQSPDLAGLRTSLGDAAVNRLLADCCPTPEIGISSTDLRNRVRLGKSVRYMTADSVVAFIVREHLYR